MNTLFYLINDIVHRKKNVPGHLQTNVCLFCVCNINRSCMGNTTSCLRQSSLNAKHSIKVTQQIYFPYFTLSQSVISQEVYFPFQDNVFVTLHIWILQMWKAMCLSLLYTFSFFTTVKEGALSLSLYTFTFLQVWIRGYCHFLTHSDFINVKDILFVTSLQCFHNTTHWIHSVNSWVQIHFHFYTPLTNQMSHVCIFFYFAWYAMIFFLSLKWCHKMARSHKCNLISLW